MSLCLFSYFPEQANARPSIPFEISTDSAESPTTDNICESAYLTCAFTSPDGAKVGHPVKFTLGRSYYNLGIVVDGKIIMVRQNADKLFYTPLTIGTHQVTIAVQTEPEGDIVMQRGYLQVALHVYPWNPLMRSTKRPMMPFWNSKQSDWENPDLFLPLTEWHNHRIARMVRNFSQNNVFPLGENAIYEPLQESVINQLYQNYTYGMDVIFLALSFPHHQQFNRLDYNIDNPFDYDTEEGFETRNWESPFAIEGPQQVGKWTQDVMDQIRRGLMSRGVPSSEAKIDQVIFDWESYLGRNQEARDAGCDPYHIYDIWTPPNPRVCNKIEDATRLDPRFEAAGGDPDDLDSWNNAAPDEQVYTLHRILFLEQDRIQKTAFYDPIKLVFPDALVSQYQYYLLSDNDRFITNFNKPAHGRMLPNAADAASPSVYFEQTSPNHGEEKTAEEIMRDGLNELRSVYRNNAPFGLKTMPWIAAPDYPRLRQDGPVPTLKREKQWEIYMHFLLSGADGFIVWNPKLYDANHNPTIYPDSSRIIQNAWATFLNVSPDQVTSLETRDESIDDSILLSAAQDIEGLVYVMVTYLNGTSSTNYLGYTLQKPRHQKPRGLPDELAGEPDEEPQFGFFVLAPPTGSITINQNAFKTDNETVRLDLNAVHGVDKMRISNRLDLLVSTPFQALRSTLAWHLNEGLERPIDGKRTVYVQFLDSVAGEMSPVIPESIILDQEVPQVSIASPAPQEIVSGYISVIAPASEETVFVKFFVDGHELSTDYYTHHYEDGSSDPYLVSLNTMTLTNGDHVLQAEAHDAAHNVTASAVVPIKVRNPV